uniref:Uncharacterized protein n=1 Tax=Tanacetum cinerariifolium TaxID=118510 RepID=A0A6L2P682_TANCI|nr:hypothetical protein [Tanacetum cinerariifolium]
MDIKKHIIDLESFRDILHICPRVPGQPFVDLPFEEEILAFIRFLGHSAAIRTLIDVNINKLYQLWRSFAALFNKCLNGKSSGYDSLRLSQAQILWGLYQKRNIDYAYLIHQNAQQFDAMLAIELKNDEIRNSNSYKEYYAIATGEATPKPKASARRTRSSSDTSVTPPTAAASSRLKASAKGKQTAKTSKAKSLSALCEVAMTEAQQLKLVTKHSMQQTHISQPSGSGADEGTDDKGDDNEEGDGDGDEENEGDDGDDNDDEDDDGEEGDDHDADQEVVRDDDKDDDEEGGDDEHESDEETREEESFDPIPPLKTVKMKAMGRGLQGTLEVEDTHVTLTLVKPDGQQESSSVSSQFVASMLNLTLDVDMESIFETTSRIDLDRLREEAQRENDEFLRTVDENIKKIIKDQVKEQVKAQVSKILPRIEQAVNEQLKAKVLTRSSHSLGTSYALVDAYEFDKIILDTYGETVTLKGRRDDDEDKDEEPSARPDRGSKRRREGKEPKSSSTPSETATKSAGRSTTGSRSRQASTSEFAFAEEPHPEWFSQPQKPPTPDRDWNKTLPAVHGSILPWINELAKLADSCSFFNELMDTPLDFSNFIMNQIRVDTLTPELLARPTYDLMKGSCKSLIELEYHLEVVYKATTDQLDWVNPKGQQCPHNLLQPLPLIPDNRGRRVIPFAYFINNDLEYLGGGASSRKYTTSEPIDYDKHAFWGVSHWGRKRQQFYGFAVNRESARDVYSKRRIIAVTKLKIIEWHSYKHLDYITNKDKKNRLMRIDKLHKFSDETLIDVCTALDDRLKGIQMRYLPQTIWRKCDKDRAATMIQATDKRLKTKRVMRSLERFVGGRLYEGDFRMLQRTI